MQQLVANGKLVLLGVTQEQHAQRCRLFAQWHELDWPILHDPINLLGPRGVPLIVAIDEHGIVRSTRPQPDWVQKTFVNANYPAVRNATATRKPVVPDLGQLERDAEEQRTFQAWQRLGDAAVLWGGSEQCDTAVRAYTAAAQLEAENASVQFRLGVAHRMRYDSARRKPDDFQAAVDHWTAALSQDPNHYIWRRRIQQYGPRSIKPYPFYDWIAKARSDIEARGQTPIELLVEPSGAELAEPAREFATASSPAQAPDPQDRITRDSAHFVRISSVVVPGTIKPGEAARVHLELQPTMMADWNNEAEPLRIWLQAPSGWSLEKPLIEYSLTPAATESHESRRLEVEVQTARPVSDETRLRGYALYYVCEKEQGTCLYRRQDFEVSIRVSDD